jgi:hypothetical protein
MDVSVDTIIVGDDVISAAKAVMSAIVVRKTVMVSKVPGDNVIISVVVVIM